MYFNQLVLERLHASCVFLLDAYLARPSDYAVQTFPVYCTHARWKVLSCGSMQAFGWLTR